MIRFKLQAYARRRSALITPSRTHAGPPGGDPVGWEDDPNHGTRRPAAGAAAHGDSPMIIMGGKPSESVLIVRKLGGAQRSRYTAPEPEFFREQNPWWHGERLTPTRKSDALSVNFQIAR